MVRLLWIDPVDPAALGDVMECLREASGGDTHIEVVSLPGAPHHLEFWAYEALVVPEILRTVRTAAERGFEAAIIGCFYDPGLYAAREICGDMVVVGPCEASCLLACALGHKFGIVVGRDKWVAHVEDNVVRYGLASRTVGCASAGMGVLDFGKDRAAAFRRLKDAALTLVRRGAETVILGCTAEASYGRELQEELGVPVIDPVVAAVRFARVLADLRRLRKWGHSRVGAFEAPPAGELDGWGVDAKYRL